jgi:hypothetical protein
LYERKTKEKVTKLRRICINREERREKRREEKR